MSDPLDLHDPANIAAKCQAPGCTADCWPHRFYCKAHRHLDPPAERVPTMQQPEGNWWLVKSKIPIRISGPRATQAVPGSVVNDVVSEVPRRILDPAVIEPVYLPDLIKEVSHLAILREGELGDVIVALAACRILKRTFDNLMTVTLHCGARFHEMLMAQTEIRIEDPKLPPAVDGTLAVDFTGYLEQDHTPTGARIPRLDRIVRTFGVSPDGND